ncbi:CC0125/CC1285 family lipoprotein [Hyphococcus sp.]|uniref:CC0125/CC1285 family lipoprotein n=1 Tax=Hyphococcus sp. TaxID=2038636 RepID=UPI003CCBBF14
MNKLLMIFIAMSLGACATVGPSAYGPADKDGFGYEETRIESDRYRITYAGSGDMPPELVEDYALLRASELALANGYDWFRIVGRDVAGEQRGGVGVGAGFGTGSYGRRSSVGVGVGGDLGTIGGRNYFTVRMEVLLGRGAPPDDGQYYDAREIQGTIGARAGG